MPKPKEAFYSSLFANRAKKTPVLPEQPFKAYAASLWHYLCALVCQHGLDPKSAEIAQVCTFIAQLNILASALHKGMSKEDLKALTQDLKKTIKEVEAAFGKLGFRLGVDLTQQWVLSLTYVRKAIDEIESSLAQTVESTAAQYGVSEIKTAKALVEGLTIAAEKSEVSAALAAAACSLQERYLALQPPSLAMTA